MKISTFDIRGPLLVEPKVFSDDRGYFFESYKQSALDEAAGRPIRFVQSNQSYSAARGTVRGLHYQSPPHAQAKLVRCVTGTIRDIIVDVRADSPTRGQSISVELSADNHLQLFVPEGFLHGFATHTPDCLVSYQVTDVYSAECDGSVRWNSPSLGLDWGVSEDEAVLSGKDAQAPFFEGWTSPF